MDPVRTAARPSTVHRRQRILAALAREPRSFAQLRAEFPAISVRTLRSDLRWLGRFLPGRLRRERHGKAHWLGFTGDIPCLIDPPLAALDEDQIAALIAARGMLRRVPANRVASERRNQDYEGAWALAIDRLLHQAGLHDESRQVAPDAISISRFGAATEEPATLPLALSAIRAGDNVRFTHTNRRWERKDVHAHPIRLVHIAGEWHLFAWAADAASPPGKIKQYRLSRIQHLTRSDTPVPHCPHSGLARDLDHILDAAFRATGSSDPTQRTRITLTVGPHAWALMHDRVWGADQTVTGPGLSGLPPDWRRLSFVTTGYDEAKHWVLSFGSEVRVEAPEKLQEWLRTQCHAITASLPPEPTP